MVPVSFLEFIKAKSVCFRPAFGDSEWKPGFLVMVSPNKNCASMAEAVA